jgi:small subunit ribosomal protein S8
MRMMVFINRGKDTIADIITSIRNANMNRNRMVRILSTNITEILVKILLREGFLENTPSRP